MYCPDTRVLSFVSFTKVDCEIVFVSSTGNEFRIDLATARIECLNEKSYSVTDKYEEYTFPSTLNITGGVFNKEYLQTCIDACETTDPGLVTVAGCCDQLKDQETEVCYQVDGGAPQRGTRVKCYSIDSETFVRTLRSDELRDCKGNTVEPGTYEIVQCATVQLEELCMDACTSFDICSDDGELTLADLKAIAIAKMAPAIWDTGRPITVDDKVHSLQIVMSSRLGDSVKCSTFFTSESYARVSLKDGDCEDLDGDGSRWDNTEQKDGCEIQDFESIQFAPGSAAKVNLCFSNIIEVVA